MNIDCKNCSTCDYYESEFSGYKAEILSKCKLGDFSVTSSELYICDRYKENPNAIEKFIKNNFKKINNFRKVNQNNSSIPFGNNDLFVK